MGDIYQEAIERDNQRRKNLTTGVDVNPYDAAIREEANRSAVQVKNRLQRAPLTPPQKAARVDEIARETFLPRNVIDRNFESIDRKRRRSDNTYDAIVQQTPRLAEWLKGDNNASVVDDDLKTMGAFEWMFEAPRRAFNAGQAQVEYGYHSFNSMFGAQDENTLQRMKDLRVEMDKASGKFGAENWFSGALVMSANQSPMLFTPFVESAKVAPAIGAALLNPAVGGAFLRRQIASGDVSKAGGFMFMQEAGHAYSEFLEVQDPLTGQRIDPGVARIAALTAGAVNAGLEIGQIGIILKTIPGVKNLVAAALTRKAIKKALAKPSVYAALLQAAKEVGVGIAAESAIEGAQRGVTVLARELAKASEDIDPDFSVIPGEIVSETIDATQAFALLMVPGPTVGLAFNVHQVRQAKKTQAYFEALNENAQKSKAIERAPKAVQELIEQQTKDGPVTDVFIDPERFDEFYQGQELDPEAVATELELRDEYEQAKAEQRDMVIPMSVYATRVAPNPQNAGLAQDLRLRADQPTIREVEELQKAVDKQAAETGETGAATAEQEEIKEQVKQQLIDTGYDANSAEAIAQAHEQVAGTLAQRSGISVREAYQRLTVQRSEGGLMTGDSILEQAQRQAQAIALDQLDPIQSARVKQRAKIAVRQQIAEGNITAQHGFRGTSVAELQAIARSGRLQVGQDAEGRPGISASDIGEGDFPMIGQGVGYIVPPASLQASGRAGESLVDERLDPTTLQYVIGDQVMSFEEMKEALTGDEVARVDPLSGQVFYQRDQVGTQEFKEWFGDSKVVDENGAPLVVFHSGDFSAEFDKAFITENGAHFGTEAAAIARIDVRAVDERISSIQTLEDENGRWHWEFNGAESIEEEGFASEGEAKTDAIETASEIEGLDFDAEITPVYLSIQNPKRVKDQGVDWSKAIAEAKEEGHDGIVYRNAVEDKGSDSYIAFEPTQIKSAIGNLGTFDTTDPNILFQQDQVNFPVARALNVSTDRPIAAAAILISGKIITASTHAAAINKAFNEGLLNRSEETGRLVLSEGDSIDLFLTREGELIDRLETDRRFAIGGAETADERGLMSFSQPRIWTPEELKELISQKEDVFGLSEFGIGDINDLSPAYRDTSNWKPVPTVMRDVDRVGEIRGEIDALEARHNPEEGSEKVILHLGDNGNISVIRAHLTAQPRSDLYQEVAALADANDLGVVVRQSGMQDDIGSPPAGYDVFLSVAKAATGEFPAPNQVVWVRNIRGAPLFQTTPGGDQPRGRLRISPDRQFRIDLFENANLSTFLHESGHFWLELLGDLVDQLSRMDPDQLTNQQLRMIQDYQTLLDWFGVKNRTDVVNKHHEQFARAEELYLLEGNAPSEKLRSAFARFTAWLKSIYRSTSELGVRLTPEVREVFDRLHATDEEIDAAQAESEVLSLFATDDQIRDAGFDQDFVDAYRNKVQEASDTAKEQARKTVMAVIARERQAWWSDEKDKLRPAVEVDLAAQPVYVAQTVLKAGNLPDGTPAEIGVLKLSRSALAPDEHKRLPRGVTTTAKGGVTPDMAAELFGFASGDELLQALKTAQPFNQAVEIEIERQLRARHGDPLLDGSMAEEVESAVNNDARAQVIEMELKALRVLQRQAAPAVRLERSKAAQEARERRAGIAGLRAGIPLLKTVREAARRRVAQMRIIDIKPHLYLSAARRHSKAATIAAAQGEFDTAVNEKQAEMFNAELYRAARDALDEADKARKFARSFDEGKKRARIGRAGQDYLDQIDAIRDNYEFSKASATALLRRKSLLEWVRQKEAAGEPVDLPDSVVVEQRINYRELPVEVLRGVVASLKHIEHLSQLKNRLLTQKEKRDLNEQAGNLGADIRKFGGVEKPPKIESRLPADKVSRGFDRWFASARKLSSYIREFDGFEDNGLAFQLLLNPINHAADTETTMKGDASKRWQEIMDVYRGDEMRELYGKTHIPALGIALSKMGRLMVALNLGNAVNKSRLMAEEGGYGWSEEQIEAIKDTLDERDWKWVQNTWDFINSYRADIAAKEVRVHGIEPVWVEAEPVQTRFGEFKGGYFPLKYDANQNPEVGAKMVEEEAKLMIAGGYTRRTTRRGHLELRKENVALPVRLDFGVISEHINQVIHDVTHHEALLDVNRLLRHREVSSAIMDHYGVETISQLKGVISDTAAGPVGAQSSWEAIINHVRMGTSVAFLGWNLFTGLLQPLGLAQSMTRIGPGWVMKGAYKWMSNAAHMEGTASWIKEKSPFMRARQDTQMREINEIMNRFGTDTGRLKGWIDQALEVSTFGKVDRAAIADSMFWLIYKGQQLADIPTWLGQYEKTMATIPDVTEETAIDLSDQAVRDSQGSGHIHDQAAIQRGGPLLKLWTNFYSYFNVTYNRLVEAGKIAKRTGGAIGMGRLAVDYFLLMLFPSLMGAFGRMLLKGELDDADEDEIMGEIVNELVSYHMGMMIGLREVSAGAEALISASMGIPPSRQVTYTGPAGVRFFESVNRTLGQAAQGEVDEAFLKAANETAGILLHYPAGQVNRTVRGYAALVDGETQNPLVLIGGPPRKR